ncbi:MAG: hypothetical protein V1835_07025 [Candidatus Micrarchaeota archaeon]
MQKKQSQKNDGKEAYNPLKESVGKERAVYNRFAGALGKIA